MTPGGDKPGRGSVVWGDGRCTRCTAWVPASGRLKMTLSILSSDSCSQEAVVQLQEEGWRSCCPVSRSTGKRGAKVQAPSLGEVGAKLLPFRVRARTEAKRQGGCLPPFPFQQVQTHVLQQAGAASNLCFHVKITII